ncbi:alpha/beta fold hydrolase [Rhizobium sp. BK176]|uniref:alpha/beta fold hydrolase n=1 Tax=Rhizobium sp. BK176 TaxID=2587071 RepID=UPI002168CC6D|nr:alpha/beta hydrolase [Rhizobium sp. BK176]MCS4089080.1 pimeloyl-ACP methyl ester carboxylesterase [Rhizobium sp. BK176]
MLPEVSEFKSRYGVLRFRDSGGEGTPLVLLHGSSYSMNVFSHLFSGELGRAFRLIALDLLGHGLSDDASDPVRVYSVRGFSDCVEDLASHLKLSSFAVFGWSLGGHVAIEVAARGLPVTGLVLSGTPPVSAGFLAALSGFKVSGGLALASKRHFDLRDAGKFESLCIGQGSRLYISDLMRADGRVRQMFGKSLMHGECHDQKRFVETTSIPVCLLNGSLDPFVRPSYIAKIKGRYPGFTPITIQDAGHAVFHEKPAIFSRILIDFLNPRVASFRAA